jgi:carboxymethylenebutenolidase
MRIRPVPRLPRMSDAIRAETITISGDGGEEIEAYQAIPLDEWRRGGVVVIHHMPGYDRSTKEIVRTFAVYGYNAVSPNLFHRYAPGARAADAAAAAREAGGVPDAQCVGDVAGAAEHLRSLPSANGKTYEFHSYEGAGHAFFSVDRPSYNLDATRDGWKHIWRWFGRYLGDS